MWKSKEAVLFLSKHFLPIGTLFIIPLGIIFPAPAVYLNAKLPVVHMCIVTLFFVIGTKFQLEEIKSALSCFKETALGIIVVLLLTPVIGTKLLMLPKFREVSSSLLDSENGTSNGSRTIELPDFGPEEFRIGLQIFCVSPCALAFPTVGIGRLLRFKELIKKVVNKLSTFLKFVTSGALLVMFWVKISQATAKGDLQKFSPWMIVAVIALGTAVITSFLVFTFILASLLRLPKKSILAVTVLSSARNSSIAIAVIENLPESAGNKDLMFLPIIFVYLAMVIIINSFGCFMTIKNEENYIEQNISTLEDKVDSTNKLTLGINPLAQEHNIKNTNDSARLPVVQWCTAV